MESEEKLILVIDDESSIRRNISDLLTPLGYAVATAACGDSGIELFKEEKPGVVILDINMPQMDGMEVLGELRNINKEVPVIMFTAFGTCERAISAMKAGAYDYIEKPFELDEFLLIVERAFQFADLVKEVKQLRTKIDHSKPLAPESEIIGKSLKMRDIYKLIGRVAPSDATILIQGESGTGKELVADAIQRHSLISEQPFVKINCGAISESLLESEIFGHEKGSFTGAVAQRKGLFEIANGGTVYLDEINSMPSSLQVKLLRVLQKQPFFRVGGDKPIHVEVRIIASSNRDIKKEVAEGRFREDLYYRLNVVFIEVPPLRERISDLSLLVEHFIQKYSADNRVVLTKDSLRKLKRYHWPGNVRELENTIQSAIVTSPGDVLHIGQLSQTAGEDAEKTDYLKMIEDGMSYKDIVSQVEKRIIYDALEKFNHNQSKTAEFLKMNRRLLYSRLKDWE